MEEQKRGTEIKEESTTSRVRGDGCTKSREEGRGDEEEEGEQKGRRLVKEEEN